MYVIRLMPKEKGERARQREKRETLNIERWSRRLVTLGV